MDEHELILGSEDAFGFYTPVCACENWTDTSPSREEAERRWQLHVDEENEEPDAAP